MATKWFVQKDDKVDGPMSAEDVQSRVQSGQLSAQALIWGRGMASWQKIQWWLGELPNLATSQMNEPTPEMWHYAHAGKSHGPFNKAALIDELKHLSNLSEVMVWTKGMKEWAALFEFHDLLTAIGVNKRQFPRADLSGKATIKTTENTLIANLLSISEGGCGVELGEGLVPGQQFTLEIQSPSFRDTLHAKAECRYVSEGVVGIKFTHVNSETKGAIIQFVRQGQPRFVLKAA
jgi:hypothetical protein